MIERILWTSCTCILILANCNLNSRQVKSSNIVEITYKHERASTVKYIKHWHTLGPESKEVFVSYRESEFELIPGEFGCVPVHHSKDSVSLRIGAYEFLLNGNTDYTYDEPKNPVHVKRYKNEIEDEVTLSVFNFYWEFDQLNQKVKVDLDTEIIYSIEGDGYKISLVDINFNSSIPHELYPCWSQYPKRVY